MNKLTRLIENNLGLSIIISSLAGLAFPYGAPIPKETIIVLLAILIFLSCFKITEPLRAVLSWKIFAFCLLRYVAAPVVLWIVCREIAPAFALGVLLLALCPAAAASAALTGIFKGNVAQALAVTIVTSLASILLIPAIIGILNHQTVAVSAYEMLKTLGLCILLPCALYLLLREKAALKNFNRSYGRLAPVVIMSLTSFVALAKTRDYFLVNPQDLLIPLAVASVFFVCVMALGLAIKAPMQDRIAYIVCSTFSNSLLGTGLALLYFDQKTTAFMIVASLMFSFMPAIAEPIIKRLEARPI
jgi:predicted Na+-dependent transporter